jgi:hypothetical protein
MYGMKKEILYKYRSINKFARIADIFVNHRLYASKFTRLNDLREGWFACFPCADDLDESTRDILKKSGVSAVSITTLKALCAEKGEWRICSLSRTEDSQVMWSHYADNHKGVAIGVEVDSAKYPRLPVKYRKTQQIIGADAENKAFALRLLCDKEKEWKHEKEVRVFAKASEEYIDVVIKRVILGCEIPDHDKQSIRALLKRIDDSIGIEDECRYPSNFVHFDTNTRGDGK